MADSDPNAVFRPDFNSEYFRRVRNYAVVLPNAVPPLPFARRVPLPQAEWFASPRRRFSPLFVAGIPFLGKVEPLPGRRKTAAQVFTAQNLQPLYFVAPAYIPVRRARNPMVAERWNYESRHQHFSRQRPRFAYLLLASI